jgi:hypothetical protein
VRTLALVAALTLLSVFGQFGARSAAATVAPTCYGEPATIVSDTPGAVVYGTGGHDVIVTLYAPDGGNFSSQTVYGYGGDDTICADWDVVYGGSGNDTILAYNSDLVSAGSGHDSLVVYNSYVVRGDSGNDTLRVPSAQTCDGGSGQDVLQEGSYCLASTVNIP